MSDKSQKESIRNTLNGVPSNPVSEDKSAFSEKPMASRGVVIDVSSDFEDKEIIKPQRTDVRLLFKVFGDDDAERSDSNSGSGLNNIVKQYDNRVQQPHHLHSSGSSLSQLKEESSGPLELKPSELDQLHQQENKDENPSFDLDFEQKPDEEDEEEITRPPRDLPPVYTANARREPEFQREEEHQSVQSLHTGTIAFMPRQDLDDESAGNTTDPEAFFVSRDKFNLAPLTQNSEAVEIKEENSPVVDDPSIPVDESGRPLAKIFRARSSSRPHTGSIRTTGHLSFAGLYDQRAIKFNREEVTESKITTSLGGHTPEIDIHLAAALEIAYSSDKEAAMRTPDLIASIISENPKQLEVLSKHFPGRLFVDPFTLPFEKLEPVSQHGPIVCAISKLQMLGVNFLTRFLRHEDRFRRFYAMMLINEMIPQSAAKIIVDRLADDNPEVRVHASSLLLKRRSLPTFDRQVLEPLREIFGKNSEPKQRVRYAARFLALVLDTKAVPIAIRLVNEHLDDDRYFCSLELLRTVTLQRYKTAEEWNKWAEGRSYDGPITRILWLIDALNDPNLSVREEAYEQLRPTFGHLLRDYLPSYPEPARRRTQNLLKVQFQTS